jgi:hypothetical protein
MYNKPCAKMAHFMVRVIIKTRVYEGSWRYNSNKIINDIRPLGVNLKL